MWVNLCPSPGSHSWKADRFWPSEVEHALEYRRANSRPRALAGQAACGMDAATSPEWRRLGTNRNWDEEVRLKAARSDFEAYYLIKRAPAQLLKLWRKRGKWCRVKWPRAASRRTTRLRHQPCSGLEGTKNRMRSLLKFAGVMSG